MSQIHSFRNLIAWQKGHQLVLSVHSIIQMFPKNEKFALSDQLWRATVSITSNIAEGFRRETSKDKAHFYIMAISSLSEVQNQLLIARDVGYIKSDIFVPVSHLSVEVSKLLQGLIQSTKRRK